MQSGKKRTTRLGASTSNTASESVESVIKDSISGESMAMIELLTDRLDVMIAEKIDSLFSNWFDGALKEILIKLEEKDDKIDKLQQENINLKRDMRELSEQVDDLEFDRLKKNPDRFWQCSSGGQTR